MTNENDNDPAFTSADTASTEENTTAAFTAVATDADGDAVTYSITGGADAALFEIDADTGEVTFKTAPDYENPADADGDNVYEVAVTASDGANATEQTVSVTVTDVTEIAGRVVIKGVDQDDQAGWSVSGAGDVDGDGKGELLVSAWRADPDGDDGAGEVYLVFGSSIADAQAGSGEIDLDGIPASDGVLIKGVGSHWLGESVSAGGEVDGDDKADILIGSGSNEAFVLFGSALSAAQSGSGVIDLATLSASDGVRIVGAAPGDLLGEQVSDAGDFDNDGKTDYVLSARLADPDGVSDAGEVYVVFGSAVAAAKGGTGLIDLGGAPASDAIVIKGITDNDRTGVSVSSAGDVDGDGVDDLVFGVENGAPDGESQAGDTYIIFGSAITAAKAGGGVIDLDGIAASDGVRIKGIDGSDFSGSSVSNVGDIDGDGKADVLIGAWGADPDGETAAGEAYLVFGSAIDAAKNGSGVIDLDGLAAADGVLIKGIDAFDETGRTVSNAGDIDGDGIEDILISSRANGAAAGSDLNAGETYVIFGSALADAKAGDGVIDLAALTPDQGVVLSGVDQDDFSAWSLSAAGDIDGDGYDDILIGARGGDPDGAESAGEAYFVSGAIIAADKLDDGVIDLADANLFAPSQITTASVGDPVMVSTSTHAALDVEAGFEPLEVEASFDALASIDQAPSQDLVDAFADLVSQGAPAAPAAASLEPVAVDEPILAAAIEDRDVPVVQEDQGYLVEGW